MAHRSRRLAHAAGLASFLLLAGPAAAEGVYLGVGFGQGRADFDTLGETIADDRESTAMKFFAGYRLARFLAVEAFFADLRGYTATVDPGSGAVDVDVEVDGVGAALVLALPLAEKADLFAKGGVFRWDVTSSTDRTNDAEAMFGLGLQLRGSSPHASLRIEYERFKNVGEALAGSGTEGIEIDLLTLGIIYSF